MGWFRRIGGGRFRAKGVGCRDRAEFRSKRGHFERAIFDFKIQLPAKWQPTYRTQLSQSFAGLNLNLDVAWGKDFNALQPIFIYNG